MPKDYYAILGVTRAADSATIHSAFRTLARQYHPDAGRGSSTSKFREALEAYQTLSDPALRRDHDTDLGKTLLATKVTPEPLFATYDHAFISVRPIRSVVDQIVTERRTSGSQISISPLGAFSYAFRTADCGRRQAKLSVLQGGTPTKKKHQVYGSLVVIRM